MVDVGVIMVLELFQYAKGGLGPISRALETLEDSEERFRSVVQTASDAIICINHDGEIVFWNNAAETVFGYSADEMVGGPLIQIIPETFREQHQQGLQRVAITRRSGMIGRTVEVIGLRKDGEEFPAEFSLATWNSSEGVFFTGIVRDITERKRVEEEIRKSVEKLKVVMEGTIQAMALTVEMRDPYTAGHQRRVAQLARAIAEAMGLTEEQVATVRLAAVVHDIGKINVPSEILTKPGKISQVEFSLIRAHVETGYDILKTIDFPWPIADVVLQHHERMDGSGYPKGMLGENILLEARILGVADVFEAMTSHRPYRPALGIEKAFAEISQNRNKLYDPAVVDACLKVFVEKGFEFN